MTETASLPELTDSRRLTGANLFWDRPSAIIDIRVESDVDRLLSGRLASAWRRAVRTLLQGVGHENEETTERYFDGGASFLVSAPIDALYSMCELNEVAWQQALAEVVGAEPVDLDDAVIRLRGLFAEERRPALLALQRAADAHGVPFLWDDDEVSVGYGVSARVWPVTGLPDPWAVDWGGIGTVPVALVTGTNGKSTTVRMAAAIIEAAGLKAGLTSTDWIRVGETILDRGDYSGTGGARMLMRHPETQIAVLETARGGLLRRGLGVERADAVLITNVDADHLGDYGINTVAELIEAKFIVRRALAAGKPMILNADDKGVVDFAARLDHAVRWFGLHPERAPLRDHLEAGAAAAYLEQGWLVLAEKGETRRLVAVEQLPSTIGGAARHNILNALGALLLCHELGIPDAALVKGLTGFRGDERDNPGRGNWFSGHDVRILVDFAHNEHGMRALTTMLQNVPARRRIVMMGQAGDRPDRDIARMTSVVCDMAPDRVLACALPGYERGRPPMEVPALIRTTALSSGLGEGQVGLFESPAEAAADALAKAEPGDLLVFLALSQRAEVLDQVHRFIRSTDRD